MSRCSLKASLQLSMLLMLSAVWGCDALPGEPTTPALSPPPALSDLATAPFDGPADTEVAELAVDADTANDSDPGDTPELPDALDGDSDGREARVDVDLDAADLLPDGDLDAADLLPDGDLDAADLAFDTEDTTPPDTIEDTFLETTPDAPEDADVIEPTHVPDCIAALGTTPTRSASCPASDASLVGCYTFNDDTETSTDVWLSLDSSSYGHHGTGTRLDHTPGIDGQALALHGDGEILLTRTALLTPAQLTLEAWVRPRADPAPTRAGIIDHGGEYAFFIYNDKTLRLYDGAWISTPYVLNEWVHLAITNDGATARAFVNGAEVAVTTPTVILGDGTNASLSIGANYPNPADEYFVGDIDTVRIWNGIRTDEDICQAAVVW